MGAFDDDIEGPSILAQPAVMREVAYTRKHGERRARLHGAAPRAERFVVLMFVPELEDRELSLDDDARLDGVAMSTEGAVKLGTPDPDAWMSIRLELNDITTTTANAVAIVTASRRFAGRRASRAAGEAPDQVRVQPREPRGARHRARRQRPARRLPLTAAHGKTTKSRARKRAMPTPAPSRVLVPRACTLD